MTGGAGRFPRLLFDGLALVVAYVALDWISFFHELGPLGITPWNPAPGVALAAMLVRGPCLAPAVFVAAVMADLLVRGMPAPLPLAAISAAVIAGGYGLAAWVLRRFAELDLGLARVRDVFWLTVASVTAAAVVGGLFVALYAEFGPLSLGTAAQALSRYWIGDMIGIAVLVPFLLVHRPHAWRLPQGAALAEAMLQGLAISLALWLIFWGEEAFEVRLFYLLFLPLIWVGVRFGLAGATIANLFAQGGLIIAVQFVDYTSTTVTTFQYLMLALATASLFLGAAVSERRGIEESLRARQDELAHFSRLSIAGEMAGALAHELNQPLLATIAFIRAAQRMLASDTADPAKAGGALDRAVGEAQRAGAIIRSLREFIGKGDTRRQPEMVSRMVADTLALVAPDCVRKGVKLTTQVDRAVGSVHVDRVQIQQVLLNLARNAMECFTASGGEITVAVRPAGGAVEIEVRDSGPGIDEEVAERLFEPFNTTKASGMGLGLSISRTIVEAHGGQLWLADTGPSGSTFRFTLPAASAVGDGQQDMGITG